MVEDTISELVSGSRGFYPQEIGFEDEMLIDGNYLNFYIPLYFDPVTVFGEQLHIESGEGYVNVYANFDLENKCVCDTLKITKVLYSGTEENYEYRLSDTEKLLIQEKMRRYCFGGETLKSIQAEYDLEKPSLLGQLAAIKDQNKVPEMPNPNKAHGPEL